MLLAAAACGLTMRVLILSQYYWPEPIPKPAELAQALRQAGDEVAVITGYPNYPAGRLYDGYSLCLVQRESIDGVPVFRTFEFPYHGTRALGRVANYVSFMLSAPLGSFWTPRVDAIYVWHPPLTVGVAAWIIARLRGIPFVYDVQDIWPEAAVLSGILKPGFVVSCLSKLERFVYQRADHLFAVTAGARSNLISKGVPPAKVSVMPHWFDESIFRSEAQGAREEVRKTWGWSGKFIALFAGNLGLVQGLETIVRAAEHLHTDENVKIVFVGDGSDKNRLVELVDFLKLQERVQFIERQPMERMPEFMAAADCLLVHLKHSELSNYVIPTKTLAYLASGRPIIMAMLGAAADLVRVADAGIVLPPEDPALLAAGIRELSNLREDERLAMGRRGRDYLERHLSKEIIVPKYRAVLAGLVEAETVV